jgi:5-(carboxyamino)imidazole ribonucleotide synthase
MVPLKNELAVIVEIHQEKSEPILVVEMEFHPEANQVEYVCPARIDDAVAEKQELSPYTFLRNSIRLIGC